MSVTLRDLREFLWSDICNTDSAAYSKFLAAADHGLQHVKIGSDNGEGHHSWSERCVVDAGVRTLVSCPLRGCEGSSSVALGIPTSGAFVGSKDNGDSGDSEITASNVGGGISAGGSGDGLRGVFHDGVDEDLQPSWSERRWRQNTEVDGRSVGTLGPNTLRNRAARLARKEKKKKRKLSGSDWRAGAGPVSHVGFFSGCDQSVRDQLRESRAAMLIAQNKRVAVEADVKTKRLESVTSEALLVSEMIRVTRMANQLKRQTKDCKIGGWAETVADSLTKSVAESAPSSVPSLQSVGYGNSALKSSDGSIVDSFRSVREIEYDMALKAVESEFDNLEVYSEQDRLDRLSLLREYYADVSKTSEERLRDDLLHKISNEMHNEGIGFQRVDDIIDRVKNM